MRSGNVLTFDALPPMLTPILVVHESEQRAYQKAHRGVQVLSTSVKGIGKTRAFICRHAVRRKQSVAAMCDDDLTGWLWKKEFASMGTIRKATNEERDRRWRIQLHRAKVMSDNAIGYAVSFTYRFALAAPNRIYTTGIKLRIGLVNECMLMNYYAMKHARFTLETAEDIESTLHWLSHGVIAGQDQRLGHTAPKTSMSAETGGCGEYRNSHDGWHLKNHRKLQKMFPDFVVEPRDDGKRRKDGMVLLKTRVGYSKAAKAGGII
jgi:hypothetical protein